MAIDSPFQAKYGSGQVVTASGTAGTATLAIGTKNIRVVNIGSALGYYRVGKSGMAACSTADVALPAGAGEIVTRAEDDTVFGHYSSGGTDFHIILGEGE